jgi:hypothetical protein
MSAVVVTSRGQKGFFEWVKKALPKTYAGIRSELSQGAKLSGLGDVDPAAQATEAPGTSSLANTIRDIATVAGQVYLSTAQVKAQQQILNVQLQRMQAGLSPLPIDPTTYGLPQPTFGVNLSASTQKTLFYIAGGIGVALLLGLLGGGRAARRAH